MVLLAIAATACRLRAHRVRNANVRPVQRASQTGIEGAGGRETLADGGMCHPIRETPPETPTKRESKPLPSGIVPDAKWPGMYRLRLPDGSLSVMVNLTRAKDALTQMPGANARAAGPKRTSGGAFPRDKGRGELQEPSL
jgi:hypothetical protein